jgi:hypothetical protein
MNRSAPTSLGVSVLTLLLVAAGAAAGGQLSQLLGLVALTGSTLAFSLGFVGLTVARAGAGRLAMSVIALAVACGVAVVSLALLVSTI